MPPARSSSRQVPVDEAFGRVLREIRLSKGLSQEALGLASGSGRTFVSQLERGTRGASLKTLFRLARELEIQPAELISRTEKALD
jgi:transcriptional regulator with XRE-family HTH domain